MTDSYWSNLIVKRGERAPRYFFFFKSARGTVYLQVLNSGNDAL